MSLHKQRMLLRAQRDLEARMLGDHKVNQKARTDWKDLEVNAYDVQTRGQLMEGLACAGRGIAFILLC